ncbi:MAG: 50S ribosomal protein L13 [Verrucomicrobia bacterium RIFCSPHIGHO2_12_FULL_41_10]|nr:MAG: 50S ribosomal protein L13 [Verrucomicrobia bacterium RIFCSPHIGHO2_12_FULL_41_10]
MNPKQKTSILTRQEALDSRKWYLLDAAGMTLGRFASEVAKILRGKHRTDFTPHVDCGDGVVIINAEKITVTGMKGARKIYNSYTGYIGGQRQVQFDTLLARKPTLILERAIKGMMPKSRLGAQQLRKLRIYAGPEHTMQAQNPTPVNM